MEFGVSGTDWILWFAGWCSIFVVVVVIWIGGRKRHEDGERFGQMNVIYRTVTNALWKTSEDLENAGSGDPVHQVRLVRRALRSRRNVKMVFLVGAMVCLVIALGKPRWGMRQEEIYQRGIDIVLLVDTSESMKAEDIAPNRLEKARSEIASLLENLEGNRIALIGFASTTRLHCPLTLDFRGLRSILDNSLTLGQGTNVENAINEGLGLLTKSTARTKAMIILSDGEGHEGDIEKAIQSVRAAGVQIFGVGIGTPEGGPIPENDGQTPGDGYKKRNGELVWTKLDETTMIRLAKETDGAYYRATPSEQETTSIAAQIENMEKSEFSQTMTTRREDRFGIFIFLAIFLLAIEAALGDFRPIVWEDRHG